MPASLSERYRAHIKTLTKHAHTALEQTGYDGVVIHSGRLVAKSSFDDQDWPFRPVPEFEHWAKVDWPDAVVFVSRGEKAKLVAVRKESFWERIDEPNWLLLECGVEVVEVASFDETKSLLPAGRLAFVGHDAVAAEALGIEDVNPTALVELLHDRRTIKTDYEIACMAEASNRAVRGHVAAREAFEAGETSELAIHLAYLGGSGQDDAQTPYKNIVALNDAAAVLHHIHYRTVDTPRSLLIDAGAAFRGYASDITRTYAAADATEFAELIARMESLQAKIIDRIEVDVPFEDLHDAAHEMMGSLLVEAGLFEGSAEAAVEGGVTRKLFPHGLGHSIGVQVHDVGMRKTESKPENPFLRNTSTMTAGQVVTIEPGLYFIDSFLAQLREAPVGRDVRWDRVEALAPFGGIRIEDNVVIEKRGVRNLTREAFAAL